jgi:hypothetical protein
MNNQIPAEVDIRGLPRWAQVAFAARIARRVLPLVQPVWLGVPESYLLALARAVDTAEQAANDGTAALLDAAARAECEANDVYQAADACGAAVGVKLAFAICGAARAAKYAAEAFQGKVFLVFGDPIAATVSDATGWAGTADVFALHPSLEELIRQDFVAVRRWSRAHEATDDTPVSPSVFGPLWPNGLPENWPG